MGRDVYFNTWQPEPETTVGGLTDIRRGDFLETGTGNPRTHYQGKCAGCRLMLTSDPKSKPEDALGHLQEKTDGHMPSCSAKPRTK